MDNQIDLDAAFSKFWESLDSGYRSPLQYYGQSNVGINYFLALSQALERRNVTPLTELLWSSTSTPKEFLPLVGDIINGNYSKRRGGPIPTHTRVERLNIYMMMCYEKYVNKKSLSTIYGELANMSNLESPLEEVYFKRLWREFSTDPSVPKFYKNST